MRIRTVWLPLAFVAAGLSALAPVAATIDIDTAHTTRLNANFSGFNDEVAFPAESFDCPAACAGGTTIGGEIRLPKPISLDRRACLRASVLFHAAVWVVLPTTPFPGSLRPAALRRDKPSK
jgi:uncharacterized protein YfaP (DUF2135 family)